MTAEEYHADCCEVPSLSSSIAAEIVAKSPAHARLKHPRITPPKPAEEDAEAPKKSPSLDLGSVVHELALKKGGGFAVWEQPTWRGAAAKEFREAAIKAGRTPIKRSGAKGFDAAENIVKRMKDQLARMDLGYVLEEGESEKVAVWKESEHWMRAMYDKWLPDRNLIVDIKTCGSDASPDKIAREVMRWNYDLRSQFYLRGAAKLTGIPARAGGLGYLFIFVETAPPYCITPCFLDATFQARGNMRAEQAIASWGRCMETGIWPGYVTQPIEIAAPGYVEFEIETDAISSS